MEHGFTWFSLIPGMEHLAHPQVPMTVLVLGFLTLVSLIVYAQAGRRGDELVIPDARLTWRNIFELIVEWLLDLGDTVIGPGGGRRYLPLFGTLFVFILVCNLMGVIPGFLPPTSNINTNAAMALTVFVVYNYFGFKEHGAGYAKHFAGPVWWLAPMMVVLEIIGHCVRPVSLSVRLFGNINGDHMVLSIFSELTKLVIPVVFLCLGIFISLIQAFVFTLLSMIYLSMAISHEH